MEKEKVRERLKKIKALAENGVGGEKDGAIELYNKLLAKYELSEDEIIEEKVERKWFRYDNDIDKKLLAQIFYKVTGDTASWVKTDKRRRLIGVDCTDFEANEIVFYYNFYKEHLQSELEVFTLAFFNVNNIFPDETARCHADTQKDRDESKDNIDLKKLAKIFEMSSGMEQKTPHMQIETSALHNYEEGDDEDEYWYDIDEDE